MVKARSKKRAKGAKESQCANEKKERESKGKQGYSKQGMYPMFVLRSTA
jgi:hypothetical protein